jgi:hypothetical protein
MRAILCLGGLSRKVQGAGAHAPPPPAALDDHLPHPFAELDPAHAAGGARARAARRPIEASVRNSITPVGGEVLAYGPWTDGERAPGVR